MLRVCAAMAHSSRINVTIQLHRRVSYCPACSRRIQSHSGQSRGLQILGRLNYNVSKVVPVYLKRDFLKAVKQGFLLASGNTQAIGAITGFRDDGDHVASGQSRNNVVICWESCFCCATLSGVHDAD